MREIAFEELESVIGEEIAVSDWVEIDQDRIDRFAEITGDHQWIHVDVARANAEMGGTIAHGFLILSLIPMMMADTIVYKGITAGLNYGADTLRFTHPVKSGSRVRMRQKVLAVETRGGSKRMRSAVTVELESADKPALVVELLSLFS